MRKAICSLVAVVCVLSGGTVQTQSNPLANTHPLYQQLRALAVAGDTYQVTDFVLAKDAASFTLTGTLHMLPPVQGKITGAVFLGKGTMAYTPPLPAERAMLANLTRGEAFNETFDKAVFRFTDGTAEAIKAAATGKGAGNVAQAQGALKETNEALRLRLRDNLHARILNDVLSPAPGGLFHAYLSGKKYSGKLAYMVDPHGAGFVAPEEVQLFSWADNKEGIFAAHHYSDVYRKGERIPTTAGGWIDIQHQVLDTHIDQSGEIAGRAATTFSAQFDGLSAVPLSLFPTLRVSSVTDESGAALPFVQESKEEDADFWIVLPRALEKGEKFTIVTTYKGKDAVSPEGQDNFFPVARSNWYPNNTGIKDYATYDMTFAVHKRMKLVATGEFVDEKVEDDKYISRWESKAPLSVAGFTLGLFKRDEAKLGDSTIVALANSMPSNMINRISQALPVGSYDTASMGYRLDSGRTGAIATSLIYPKGAYVLHMLRMMMWNRETGDAKFKVMLRDFIATHRNQPITTEDFKAAVEKHMLPEMNLDGDGTMNWFFRQFVYGTELPSYKLQQSVSNKGGQNVISMKLTQANVSDGFKMQVPLYVELQDGRMLRIGSAGMVGSSTVEQEIPIGQLQVKRLLINYYYDVLALEEK